MKFTAAPAALEEVMPLREKFRAEMDAQIVHDSLHRREGWTRTWILKAGDRVAGFGSIAVEGPWKGKPTLFEFFVGSRFREVEDSLFDVLVPACRARFIEAQTNEPWIARQLPRCAPVTITEKIIFKAERDPPTPRTDADAVAVTPAKDCRARFRARDGAGEWKLELGGQEIGRGGIAFHYNQPYCDLYFEIDSPWRRRGYGYYFLSRLKSRCRQLGGIPAARCDPENAGAIALLAKGGFARCGDIVSGPLAIPGLK